MSFRRRITEIRLPDDLPIVLGLLTTILVCVFLFSIYRDAVVPSIDLNGRAVGLVGSDEHVTVLDKAGTLMASTDLHAFDYIGSIRAAPFCRNPNGDHNLAVLVTLRATSKRAMLIVCGPDVAVVYQEHLERTGSGSGWAGAM